MTSVLENIVSFPRTPLDGGQVSMVQRAAEDAKLRHCRLALDFLDEIRANRLRRVSPQDSLRVTLEVLTRHHLEEVQRLVGTTGSRFEDVAICYMFLLVRAR